MNRKNNELSPKLLYATKLALVVLVLSIIGLFFYFFQPDLFKLDFLKRKSNLAVQTEVATTTTTTAAPACTSCVRNFLDGEMVSPELEKLRPYAVMIDNFPAARPQSGLSYASLVYEAPVEGGITRYEAFFSPSKAPAEIGPIRSARTYFLNWAKELGATYVHVGGSPEALTMAKNLGSSNLDEFFKDSYFIRSAARSAPHNILISGDNLNKYRAGSQEIGLDFAPWQFKDGAPSSLPFNSQIKIKYGAGYDVIWQYQPATNDYLRYLDNAPHLDADGSKITAKNVIVHLVSFKVVDDKLRLEMSTALSDQALLCQDAVCSMGTWKKNSAAGRAKYYLKNGDEFPFNAGVTWIEVLGNLNSLEY